MATVTFKCPNCGGGLQFEPEGQSYHCEYCASDFTQTQLDTLTPDAAAEQRESADTGEQAQDKAAVLYTCPSCGAEIVTDETTAATFCYYCHNPVVLAGRLEGEYLPNYVIPFAIDRQKAIDIFTQWIKRKKYVPKAFFSKEQIEKLSGVYFPYILYSCQVDGEIDGEAMKNKSWTTGNIRFTEVSRFHVNRQGMMKVDHVARNVLKKANKQLVEGVLPFEMEHLKPFSMGYLSGFQAEKRDMGQQEYSQEIEAEVRDFAAASLQGSIGSYDSFNLSNKRADIKNPIWNYALLPVWTLTYKDNKTDKVYYFALNGQNGKICGELPVDMGRLAVLFAAIFIPLLIVLLIGGYIL